MKVYLIYKDNSLYAYTNNKKYKDLFLNNRNKRLFKVEKCTMDDDEYETFSSINRRKELQNNVYGSSFAYCNTISTLQEDIDVQMASDVYDEELKSICKSLLEDDSRISEDIEYLYNTSMRDNDHIVSRLNTLSVFVSTHYDTF